MGNDPLHSGPQCLPEPRLEPVGDVQALPDEFVYGAIRFTRYNRFSFLCQSRTRADVSYLLDMEGSEGIHCNCWPATCHPERPCVHQRTIRAFLKT